MHDAEMRAAQSQVESMARGRRLARELDAVAASEEERVLAGDVKFAPLLAAVAKALSETKSAGARLRALERFLRDKATLDVKYAKNLQMLGQRRPGGGGSSSTNDASDTALEFVGLRPSRPRVDANNEHDGSTEHQEEGSEDDDDRDSSSPEFRFNELSAATRKSLRIAADEIGPFAHTVASSLVGVDVVQLTALFGRHATALEQRLLMLHAARVGAGAAVARAYSNVELASRALRRRQQRQQHEREDADPSRQDMGCVWVAQLAYAEARVRLAAADNALVTEAAPLLARMRKLRAYRERVCGAVLEALVLRQRRVWANVASAAATPRHLAEAVASNEGRAITEAGEDLGAWEWGRFDGSSGAEVSSGDAECTPSVRAAHTLAALKRISDAATAAEGATEAKNKTVSDGADSAHKELAPAEPSFAIDDSDSDADGNDDDDAKTAAEEEGEQDASEADGKTSASPAESELAAARARRQSLVELAQQAVNISVRATEGSLLRHLMQSPWVAKTGMLQFETSQLDGFGKTHAWLPVLCVWTVDRWLHAFNCKSETDFDMNTKCLFAFNIALAKITSPCTDTDNNEHQPLSILIEDTSSVLDRLRTAGTEAMRSGMVSGLELMVDSLPKVRCCICAAAKRLSL